MPLTDVACKNAKCPPDKARARFNDAGGLYLEVVPTDGKHSRWKYRIEGKEKRLALGSDPGGVAGRNPSGPREGASGAQGRYRSRAEQEEREAGPKGGDGPALGAKPISEIKASEVLSMAKKIEQRGALDLSRSA